VMLRCPAKYAMLLAHAVAIAVAIGFWGTRKQWDGLHPPYLVDVRREVEKERSHGHYCCRC
jgi:hypothetical protein